MEINILKHFINDAKQACLLYIKNNIIRDDLTEDYVDSLIMLFEEQYFNYEDSHTRDMLIFLIVILKKMKEERNEYQHYRCPV